MSPWLAWAIWVGCAAGPESPVHAEAWVGAGRVAPASLPALLRAAPVSVDGPARDGRYRVVASTDALAQLEAQGLTVHPIRDDHRRPAPGIPGYHDAEEMLDELAALAAAYPDRARLVDVGRSVEGRPLVALRIGGGDWRVRVLAAHHGDELSSAELSLALARRLLEAPVEPEVWILPHVNPDGVVRGTRYNARNVDLNRNYGYRWSDSEYRAGEGPFSEPEARAVRVMSSYRGFGAGLSMHSGAALIAYIWNYTTQNSPDEQLLVAHSEAYDRDCGVGGFYVINGGGWYITYGDTTDWSYGRQGTLDYTLEVSEEKAPPAAELPELIEDHMDAMLAFVERPPAVVGVVTDAADGGPIEATVEVEGGWSSVAGPDGRFARWLPEGEHRLVIDAPGFLEQTIEIDHQGDTETLTVELQRGDLLTLRPEPALLSWSEQEQWVSIPQLDDSSITLFRPGYEDHAIERDGDGYILVSSELAPGPWGIRASTGEAPRSLFIGERDDRVRLGSVDQDGDVVALEGVGFEPGSAAWAITGEARTMIPLEVRSESGGRIELDAQGFDESSGVVDLLVVSSGAQLTALDLAGGGSIDTGAPGDTDRPPGDGDSGGLDSLPPAPGGGGCGCDSRAAASPSWFLLALATAVGLRRRSRNPCRCRVSEKDEATVVSLAASAPGS